MLPLNWPSQQFVMDCIQSFERRKQSRGESGALIMWAADTVESIYYLEDLHTAHRQDEQLNAVYRPDLVNTAHIRWATSASITSIDLCAAVLAAR